MRTKRWPETLAAVDPNPEELDDPSAEVMRVVVHGEHVFFFLWCWDMSAEGPQVSVLFRAPLSFDADAVRLASIRSEMVDLARYDGALFALENGVDAEGGFGAVHRLSRDATVPASTVRFKLGKVFKTLGHGADGQLYAAGNAIFTFDGATWRARLTPKDGVVQAIAGAGSLTAAVGDDGLVLTLDRHEPRLVAHDGATFEGVFVHADGNVSVAGRDGCFEGPLERLTSLDAPAASFNDCVSFQGKTYWSAAGDEGVGGLYVQNGRKLGLVFEDGSCFRLTATDRYLFAATDFGVVRYDGETWKPLYFDYDADASVWKVTRTPPADDE
ncbi:MAG: hypothetical protein KIT84_10210 [Labilithrix sp.]|nr:hypothetical protein [Labilithrix sp.]MCW5811377.1 hypothetical protein [Labilithrix sp.]